MHLPSNNADRVFLFLQGPHGPFFQQLARQLQQTGAITWRVGFNAGDRAFWCQKSFYLPFQGKPEEWVDRFTKIVNAKSVTDIVLYGDTRPIHAQAIARARQMSLCIHVFEEGYLRPYWVTYERGGSNGHSSLMSMPLQQMAQQQEIAALEHPIPPSHWGDMRQHVFYGALYHWFVMALNQRYRNFTPHRSLSVGREFKLYLKRLILMPFQSVGRRIATARIQTRKFPYHLALLQLEHDSSFQMHGPFQKQADFLATVIEGFANGAPKHHHLVFKSHPLEDGRAPITTDIRRFARQFGIANRVHFIRGGKLAGLLNEARTAVTVNSTAGQQVLWRNIPLRLFGACVYDKPELISRQPIEVFFANPDRPDPQAYRTFRDYLLATSQLPGSFYASKGRRQVLRHVCDMMLNTEGPYAPKRPQTEAVRQQLRVVQ